MLPKNGAYSHGAIPMLVFLHRRHQQFNRNQTWSYVEPGSSGTRCQPLLRSDDDVVVPDFRSISLRSEKASIFHIIILINIIMPNSSRPSNTTPRIEGRKMPRHPPHGQRIFYDQVWLLG